MRPPGRGDSQPGRHMICPERRHWGSGNMSSETIYEDLLELTIALAKERRVEALLAHVLEASQRLSNAEGAAIFTLDRLARSLHRVCFNYRGITNSNQIDSRIALYDKSLMPNLRDPATFAVSTATL